MRFFSKLMFILNLCFIVYVVLEHVEHVRRSTGNHDAIIPLQPIEGSLVALGYIAIFVNFFYLVTCLVMASLKRKRPSPMWIFWFNFILFAVQIYYFFIYKR